MKYDCAFVIETQHGYYPIGTWGFACVGGSTIEEAISTRSRLGDGYRIVDSSGSVVSAQQTLAQRTVQLGVIVECNCQQWKLFAADIFEAQIFFSQNTGYHWTGEVWSFCPWCGSKLNSAPHGVLAAEDSKVVDTPID